LKIDRNSKSAQIKLNDSLQIYSLINTPSTLQKQDLITLLSLDSFGVSRIYKKHMVWILISNSDKGFALEEKLKNSHFGNVDNS
jgi:hypothetical protein